MPKINIRYNKILDKITKGYCLTLPEYSKTASKETDTDFVSKKIDEYALIWNPIEDKVFQAIEQITHKPFPFSRLTANIVWVVNQTEAHALIIPTTLTPDGFVMTLTHELMHLSGGKSTQEFTQKYAPESAETRVHILIHSMTEYLWRDVINKPEYVEIHKERCKRNKDMDYIRAWEIVDEVGYKNVISAYLK